MSRLMKKALHYFGYFSSVPRNVPVSVLKGHKFFFVYIKIKLLSFNNTYYLDICIRSHFSTVNKQ